MTTATSVHTVPFTKREEAADSTMAFHFAKPADFQFRAGQSVDIMLLNPPETDAALLLPNNTSRKAASSWRRFE